MMPMVSILGVDIPTFFVVISLSLSVLVFYLSIRIDELNLDRRKVFDVAILIMVTGFIGGRLLHVFYEEWPYYQRNPERILYFWQGGYVFFGGFFAALGSTLAYCKIRNISFWTMSDIFAPLLSLSHAFGRLSCFFSGCCYGTYCELPWAISGRHPTTLYLFFGELLIYLYLMFYEKKIKASKSKWTEGAVFMKWVLLHSLLRLNVEYFRDDFRGHFFNIFGFGKFSISQVISLALTIWALAYFIRLAGRVKKETA